MSTNYVLVLDTNRKPLNPCKPGTARGLLQAGKAAVFKRYPFTIILNKAVEDKPEPVQLKIDPGSKVTGLALVQDDTILWGAELHHRAQQIKSDLADRRALRRGRRNRKTRYRQPRFLNRTRPEGGLAPSLMHRVLTTMTWVRRLTQLVPVTGISLERVRFDTQKMMNPEVSGVDYHQGELQGYEVREYLLEKWNRTCAYCGATDTRLEVEHIHPRSKGGSDRVSNLTLACHDCNQAKGNQEINQFLSGKPDVLNRILSQAKQPLKDAAAVNSTRNRIAKELDLTGLPVEFATGGQTKYNRCRLALPKTHWLDAACVGEVDSLTVATEQCLTIKASGHGNRQMAGVDKFGFPKRHRTRQQIHFGFSTGDLIRAVVAKGKKAGTHVGRVLCRKSGSFDIQTQLGRVAGINQKYCRIVHGRDGYAYAF